MYWLRIYWRITRYNSIIPLMKYTHMHNEGIMNLQNVQKSQQSSEVFSLVITEAWNSADALNLCRIGKCARRLSDLKLWPLEAGETRKEKKKTQLVANY